jgi:hypothetical protein
LPRRSRRLLLLLLLVLLQHGLVDSRIQILLLRRQRRLRRRERRMSAHIGPVRPSVVRVLLRAPRLAPPLLLRLRLLLIVLIAVVRVAPARPLGRARRRVATPIRVRSVRPRALRSQRRTNAAPHLRKQMRSKRIGTCSSEIRRQSGAW